MKKRIAAVLLEMILATLAVLFVVWRMSAGPAAAGETVPEAARWLPVCAVLYIAVVTGIGVQIYFCILRPYSVRVKELEKAAEESREAEDIRREFVANVSHELKTPLTSISGFIETLQDGASEDPEIRSRFIDIIAIETARLKRLIEDLLVLSDIESRKNTEWSEFDVKDATDRTLDVLRPLAEEKDIEIIEELDDDIKLEGSSDRFSQMMLNLIENAIKYSDRGGRIWVRAIKGRDRVYVSVKDEGIGIAPEHHQRLFERFYRVDKSRSKKVGGTGLGLSIVKHIAALFDASLHVESRVGEGTTFYVTFDLEKK